MYKIVFGLVAIIALFGIIFSVYCGLWYSVDDWLANAFNVPALGNIPWYVVVVLAVLTSMLTSSGSSKKS